MARDSIATQETVDMKNPIDMHRLARLGAIARLQELEDEAAAIRRAFPGLKKAEAATDSPAPTPSARPTKRKKRTRNVSPEVRQAAAERMRAYWAKKKGTQADAASASANAAPRRKAKGRRRIKKA
jgi:hypothetical protein